MNLLIYSHLSLGVGGLHSLRYQHSRRLRYQRRFPELIVVVCIACCADSVDSWWWLATHGEPKRVKTSIYNLNSDLIITLAYTRGHSYVSRIKDLDPTPDSPFIYFLYNIPNLAYPKVVLRSGNPVTK